MLAFISAARLPGALCPAARSSPVLLARGLAALAVVMAGAACLPAAANEGTQGTSGGAASTPSSSSSSGASYGPSSSQDSQGRWWAPGSGRSLIGLNAGRSTYQAACGTGLRCDDTDRYFSIYGRNMSDSWWGSEIGYVDMGRMERAGGDTRARGINLSLVGRAPVAEPFGVFGKVGVTFGHTSTGTAPGATIAGGSKNGFGLSLGAGVSWDFTPKLAAVLEWDRHDFRFEGGRDAVRATSVGLQYKY